VAATAANVHDSHLLPDLLHGYAATVSGPLAYPGKGDVIHTRRGCGPRSSIRSWS